MPPSDYPGVYIEETAMGVRRITGVRTSIAAFVGWAAKGPVDRASRVGSFGDFERVYGGLDPRSVLGYAVRHFFANGGREAFVIRLVAGNARAGAVTIDEKIRLVATSPGKWSEDYAVGIARCTEDPERFRLTVVSHSGGEESTAESFDGLSISASDPRFAIDVINGSSALVQAELVGSPTRPPEDIRASAETKLTGGDDGEVLAPNSADFEERLSPVSGRGGLYLLDDVDHFNLLCVPGETKSSELARLQAYCRSRRAFLIADCAEDATLASMQAPNALDGLTGADAMNSALFFPWVEAPDPFEENRQKRFPPYGFVAGVFARTDATRSVWKSPEGVRRFSPAPRG